MSGVGFSAAISLRPSMRPCASAPTRATTCGAVAASVKNVPTSTLTIRDASTATQLAGMFMLSMTGTSP